MDKKVEIGDHHFVVENAYNGPWFSPGKGVKGTIDFSFKSKTSGEQHVWLYIKHPAKAFALNLNGKQYPTGWAKGTNTRATCWQWKRLTTTSRKDLKVSLKSGENILKVGLCGISVFAKVILTSTNVDFYGKGPDPENMPQGSIMLLPSQGKATGEMVLKRPNGKRPKALFSFLNPKPIVIKVRDRRYKTRFYGKQLVILPQVVAERNTVNPRFLVFAYPYKDGMEQPAITSSEKNGVLSAKIEWRNATDWILSSGSGRMGKSGSFETDANLAVVRKYKNGEKTRYIIDGKHLSMDGRVLKDR